MIFIPYLMSVSHCKPSHYQHTSPCLLPHNGYCFHSCCCICARVCVFLITYMESAQSYNAILVYCMYMFSELSIWYCINNWCNICWGEMFPPFYSYQNGPWMIKACVKITEPISSCSVGPILRICDLTRSMWAFLPLMLVGACRQMKSNALGFCPLW